MGLSDPETATLADSFTEMSEVVMPNETNNLGRALGGTVLHWMDICGAIAARRFARRQVVTASMDHVDFLAPIDLGDIVVLDGHVFETGTTSMGVAVTVHAERPAEGVVRECATSGFTFVAIDEDGDVVPVPDLACPTPAEREHRDRALARRRTGTADA